MMINHISTTACRYMSVPRWLSTMDPILWMAAAWTCCWWSVFILHSVGWQNVFNVWRHV